MTFDQSLSHRVFGEDKNEMERTAYATLSILKESWDRNVIIQEINKTERPIAWVFSTS